ncbi:hypothetical protein VNO77_03866 [Canavalia gladiata]|uniref:Uncharacterized protein n=1 Tax=Canavalia gladiata TaxID=3824 RepID=A0AAN9MW43_CANGL
MAIEENSDHDWSQSYSEGDLVHLARENEVQVQFEIGLIHPSQSTIGGSFNPNLSLRKESQGPLHEQVYETRDRCHNHSFASHPLKHSQAEMPST